MYNQIMKAQFLLGIIGTSPLLVSAQQQDWQAYDGSAAVSSIESPTPSIETPTSPAGDPIASSSSSSTTTNTNNASCESLTRKECIKIGVDQCTYDQILGTCFRSCSGLNLRQCSKRRGQCTYDRIEGRCIRGGGSSTVSEEAPSFIQLSRPSPPTPAVTAVTQVTFATPATPPSIQFSLSVDGYCSSFISKKDCVKDNSCTWQIPAGPCISIIDQGTNSAIANEIATKSQGVDSTVTSTIATVSVPPVNILEVNNSAVANEIANNSQGMDSGMAALTWDDDSIATISTPSENNLEVSKNRYYPDHFYSICQNDGRDRQFLGEVSTYETYQECCKDRMVNYKTCMKHAKKSFHKNDENEDGYEEHQSRPQSSSIDGIFKAAKSKAGKSKAVRSKTGKSNNSMSYDAHQYKLFNNKAGKKCSYSHEYSGKFGKTGSKSGKSASGKSGKSAKSTNAHRLLNNPSDKSGKSKSGKSNKSGKTKSGKGNAADHPYTIFHKKTGKGKAGKVVYVDACDEEGAHTDDADDVTTKFPTMKVPSEAPTTPAAGALSKSPTTAAPSDSPTPCTKDVVTENVNLCIAIDASGSVCGQRTGVQCYDCNPAIFCRTNDVEEQTCCTNFATVKDFSAEVLRSIDVFEVEKDFSIVQFADDAIVENELAPASEALQALDDMVYSGGFTNHAAAIEACQQTLSRDEDRKKFLLLITDGVATAPANAEGAAEEAATLAKEDGVTIIPVFISSSNDADALAFMSRLSSNGRFFDVSDFESLNNLQENLVNEVSCSE